MYTGSSIDWGKIAQQWIQMRDKSIANSMPAAPPPPNISGQPLAGPSLKSNTPNFQLATKKTTFEEHGVADMDMDDEDENGERDQRLGAVGSPDPTSGQLSEHSSIMQAQWFMQQIESEQAAKPTASTALSSTAASQWNMWPTRGAISPTVVPTPPIANSTAHIPSLMKINVPNPNAIRVQHDAHDDEASSSAGSTMDAAKRKMLPAWIREGLEKMEREKQKQLEREQQKHNSKDYDDDRLGLSYGDGENLNTLNDSMVKTNSPKILESDSSGNEDDEDVEPNEDYIDGKALEAVDSSAIVRSSDNEDEDELEQSIGKSYEQKLADLMIVVRRNLTELLLEVTNEEIANIAQETINAHKSKASSAQVIRKSALSSITGKLGLAAYADSSSDSNSSDSENDGSTAHDEDSEEDIQASIRSKRRAFAKISEDIEERVAAAAQREELKLKHYLEMEQQRTLQIQEKKNSSENPKDGNDEASGSVSTESAYAGGKGYDREFGETTESKLQQTNGKRQKDRLSRKERTTRFSDNKDSKAVAALPAVPAFIAQYPIAHTSADTVATPSGLYTMASNSQSSTAVSHAYIAAEATLDRVTKNKSSSVTSDYYRRRHERDRDHEHRDRHSRRHRRSRSSEDDSSSTSSTDSDDSTASSDSSGESKYSRDSSVRRRDKADRHSSKRHRKGSSSASKSKKIAHHSSDHSKRRRRHHSSDSDDYDSRDYYHSRHSSSKHSRRSRSRSRSRSKSKSSYSSSSRRRH